MTAIENHCYKVMKHITELLENEKLCIEIIMHDADVGNKSKDEWEHVKLVVRSHTLLSKYLFNVWLDDFTVLRISKMKGSNFSQVFIDLADPRSFEIFLREAKNLILSEETQ